MIRLISLSFCFAALSACATTAPEPSAPADVPVRPAEDPPTEASAGASLKTSAPADVDEPASYEALVARLKAGRSDVDHEQLRLAFADTDAYGRWQTDGRVKDMWAAFNNRQDDDAVRLGEAILQERYIDIDAHKVLAAVALERGDKELEARHMKMAIGLLRTIIGAELARSADRPGRVVAVAEEYAVMRALGWRLNQQALSTCLGRPCDVLEVQDKTGQTLTLYFDVSLPMQKMQEAMGL